MLQLSLAPLPDDPEGRVGLYAGGLLVPGVRALIDEGGDLLVVIDRAAVRIDPALRPAPAAEARD